MKSVLVVAAVVVTTAVLAVSSHFGGPGLPASVRPVHVDHHCADLLVRTETQLGVVPGVWNCLEPGVQALFKGSGDGALITHSPFTGSRFIDCDSWVCVYALTFDATTAAVHGMNETTMTVWLDRRGLVAHAAIPKPVP